MEKTIARNFYESYAAKNLDKSFDDYIATDLVNHTMGGGFDRDKWKAFDKSFVAGLSDFKVTVLKQIAEGEYVATHFTMEGKHTGEISGMPPTGNTVKLEAVAIDLIKNGKLSIHNSIGNFTSVMQQLTKK